MGKVIGTELGFAIARGVVAVNGLAVEATVLGSTPGSKIFAFLWAIKSSVEVLFTILFF